MVENIKLEILIAVFLILLKRGNVQGILATFHNNYYVYFIYNEDLITCWILFLYRK